MITDPEMQMMFVCAKTLNLLSLFIPFQAVYTASVALQLKIEHPVKIPIFEFIHIFNVTLKLRTTNFESAFLSVHTDK